MSERGRGGGEGVRTRDHLASVRTTLAWVRTGMILMGAGYATDKVAALGGPMRAYGRPLGLLLVGTGMVVAAAALPRFVRSRRRIESGRFEPRPGADLALVGGVGVGALVVLILLAVTR
ncbi:MAG TPA: DUF202 domain-containing protein [Candidatus Dormibacteraeota bacterium]|nr:DUF202 domain-containing protein [Candidatus Dormibacteraeota bacterium]